MDIYRKTNQQFFLACAYLRHSYGLDALSLEHIELGKWLSEPEILDFTLSYMAGGEL